MNVTLKSELLKMFICSCLYVRSYVWTLEGDADDNKEEEERKILSVGRRGHVVEM